MHSREKEKLPSVFFYQLLSQHQHISQNKWYYQHISTIPWQQQYYDQTNSQYLHFPRGNFCYRWPWHFQISFPNDIFDDIKYKKPLRRGLFRNRYSPQPSPVLNEIRTIHRSIHVRTLNLYTKHSHKFLSNIELNTNVFREIWKKMKTTQQTTILPQNISPLEKENAPVNHLFQAHPYILYIPLLLVLSLRYPQSLTIASSYPTSLPIGKELA